MIRARRARQIRARTDLRRGRAALRHIKIDRHPASSKIEGNRANGKIDLVRASKVGLCRGRVKIE